MVVCLHVVPQLPVWFPTSEQREPWIKRHSHCLCRAISVSPWSRDVSHLVSIIQPPDFIRQLKVDSFEWIFNFSSSWTAVSYSRKFALQGRPLINHLVVFSNSHISPMRYLDNFLDWGELYKRIVVDSKHRMLDNCEGLQAAPAKLNFSSFFGAVWISITE